MSAGPDGRLLQGVLVDMDGTLVDTEPYWAAGEGELVRSFGLDWSEEEALELIGNDLLVSGRHLHAKGVRLQPERIVDVLVDGVRERVLNHVPWRPGARELLGQLADAGIPAVLVTMSYRRLAEAVVRDLPEGWLAALVTGDEVSRGKPHPEPYQRAAGLLGAQPGRCVAIEDSQTGLTSAESAGCVSLAVPHIVPIPPAPGRTIVASLVEVDVAFLERLVAAATRS